MSLQRSLSADAKERLNTRLQALIHQLEHQEQKASLNFSRAYDIDPSSVTTSAVSFTDLGGPSIELTIPSAGAWVMLYAELEIQNSAVSEGGEAAVSEATDLPTPYGCISSSGDDPVFNPFSAFNTSWDGDFDSLNLNIGEGSGLILPASPGVRTYELKHYASYDGSANTFRNRQLWGIVIP